MTVTFTDLFCGAGGSSLGAEAAGMELKLAMNHWRTAIDVHQLHFPDAGHDCFPADVLVLTESGHTPINEVKIGTLVLTHRGRWRPVVRVFKKRGSTIRTVGTLAPAGVESTSDHKFWIRRSRLAVQGSDYERHFDEPSWVEIGDASVDTVRRSGHERDFWSAPCTSESLDAPSLPDGFDWWIVGRWLGDGSANLASGAVEICCGHHEREDLATKLTGWKERETNTAILFYRYHKPTLDWLVEHFGKGSAGKDIPGWALTLPRADRVALLEGYISADGNRRDGSVRVSSVSKALALGCRDLALSLGYAASLHHSTRKTHATIEGRSVKRRRDVWTAKWKEQPQRTHSFEDGRLRWAPIRSAAPARSDIEVFTLEVEDDHSYVADGIVVKNCADISQADPRRYVRTDVLLASPECFPAGTLVTTGRGQVPIEQVEVGDFALTHLGRWRRVTRTQVSAPSTTVVVKGQGHWGLEATPNHGLPLRSQDQEWNNDRRQYDRSFGPVEKVKAGEVQTSGIGRHRWGTPAAPGRLDLPEGCNPELAWLWGRYLADGYCDLREGRGGSVTISVGEAKVGRDGPRLEAFGFRPRKVRTAVNYVLRDRPLADWLAEHFGHLAPNKQIPSWLIGRPELSRAVIEGYVSGDGYDGGRYTSISTVSRKLAVGIRLLLVEHGFHPGSSRAAQHCDQIEGRELNVAPWVYTVRWENNASQRSGTTIDDSAWTLIKSVEPGSTEPVEVYNIEVEEDHTYLADGIAVYNCTHHSQARGVSRRQQDPALWDAPDPAAERSRATMWDVVRFAEQMRYEAIVVENVVDACFVGETVVLTKRGTIPIADIEVGDEVMTHNARWRTVTAKRSLLKPTVRVAGYGNTIMETTADHRFFSREYAPLVTQGGKAGRHKSRLLEPEWREIGQMTPPSLTESSTYRSQHGGFAWATPTSFAQGWTRPPRRAAIDTDSEAFWYIVGRWLGDGWIVGGRRGNQRAGIRVCCANHEADELREWTKRTGAHWVEYQHTQSVRVFQMDDRKLVTWLRANFGEKAAGKRLPGWIFSAEGWQRQALLDGYAAADGHERSNGRVSTVSVSRPLAVGVKMLAQSLGYRASITSRPGGELPTWSESSRQMFTKASKSYTVDWHTADSDRHDKAWQSELHAWGKVRSVEPARQLVEVFDITVEDDHSFIADGQVVHNCNWINWRSWLMAMEELGYERRILSHNSMHHGVPQSRDRIYVVFTRKGLKVDLEMELPGWCGPCEKPVNSRQTWKNGRTIGRYGKQYFWSCPTCGGEVKPPTRGAGEIIDWSIEATRIGDRSKPLVEKTIRRIAAGLARYGWLDPVVTAGAGHTHERTPGNRAKTLDVPLSALQTTATHALAAPASFLVQTAHGGDRRPYGLDEPHPTVTASDDRHSLVVPMRKNGNAYPTWSPLATVTAGGNHHGLLMRNNHGGAEMVTPLDEPARTMTTKGHQSFLAPGQVKAGPSIGDLAELSYSEVTDLVSDCGFRMLEPAEVIAAMAFPAGYIPDHYTKKDKVKLAGNAVTPPVQQWISGRIVQALEAA